ncbi:hypothetical protein VWU02_20290, partial [Xanthomonas citri pv. citri]
LGLLEHGDDLAVGKAGLLHGTSSGKGTRKFHFWRLLMGGGITPPASLPPCELIFEEYDSALKDAGFEPQLGIYNEFGWVISFQYLRGNIRAQIIPWHPVSLDPQRKSRENCVRSISLHKYEE